MGMYPYLFIVCAFAYYNKDSDCLRLLQGKWADQALQHKLMELWQSVSTLDALQMAIDPITKEPYLPSNKLREVEVVFEDNEVGPVWDLWGMLTGGSPTRLKDLPAGCKGE